MRNLFIPQSLFHSQVKDRFQHWRESRLQNQQVNGGDRDDAASINSDAESELERLMTPEIDTQRQPVPEEDFDNLADQIAKRVKGSLGIEQQLMHLSPISTGTSYVTEEEDPTIRSWNSSRCKTFTRDVPTFNHQGTSGLTSHSCAICKKIMVSKLIVEGHFFLSKSIF